MRNQENLFAGRSKASWSIWYCKTGGISSLIPFSDTIPENVFNRLFRKACFILHSKSTGSQEQNITFQEFAEVESRLGNKMWHHLLVKTYVLKN